MSYRMKAKVNILAKLHPNIFFTLLLDGAGHLQLLDWTSGLDWTGGLDWWTDATNHFYAFQSHSLTCGVVWKPCSFISSYIHGPRADNSLSV